MLANLLPGIREIRGPLATGYLWLFFSWLVWARHLPDAASATGLLADVYELAALVGTAGVGIAVSFAAYLIGVLSLPLATPLTALLRWMRSDRSMTNPGPLKFVPTSRSEKALRRLVFALVHARPRPVPDTTKPAAEDRTVTEQLLETARRLYLASFDEEADLVNMPPPTGPFETAVDQLASSITAELRLIPPRLVGTEPDLYNAHDRLRAEAEFRRGVTVPLAAICGPLGAATTPGLGFALAAMALVLLLSAATKEDEARLLLVEAVRSGRLIPGLTRDLSLIGEPSSA
ncbi:hypothetical protein ACQPYK_33595 [Streptosporangium sp. CA-135522]|uniref:hypothetical protein n=1 Tax=Streptosporangium sp. CA-135522 TaxID=3240072 RepID=UPI003D8D4241